MRTGPNWKIGRIVPCFSELYCKIEKDKYKIEK